MFLTPLADDIENEKTSTCEHAKLQNTNNEHIRWIHEF